MPLVSFFAKEETKNHCLFHKLDESSNNFRQETRTDPLAFEANGNTVFRVEVLVAQQEFFSDISENVPGR